MGLLDFEVVAIGKTTTTTIQEVSIMEGEVQVIQLINSANIAYYPIKVGQALVGLTP